MPCYVVLFRKLWLVPGRSQGVLGGAEHPQIHLAERVLKRELSALYWHLPLDTSCIHGLHSGTFNWRELSSATVPDHPETLGSWYCRIVYLHWHSVQSSL